MNERMDLRDALRQLAETLPREVSAGGEARMLAAFRANRRRAPAPWVYWATAAACIAAGVAGFWSADSWQGFASDRFHTAAVTSDSFHTATAGFVALPYAESGVPLEDAVIVRMKLRPSELGALGVPLGAMNATSNISADLLIGQDGIARAVRVVY